MPNNIFLALIVAWVVSWSMTFLIDYYGNIDKRRELAERRRKLAAKTSTPDL